LKRLMILPNTLAVREIWRNLQLVAIS
jgi:hypothetical protein